MDIPIEPFWTTRNPNLESALSLTLSLRDESGPCGDGKHIWLYASTATDSEIPLDTTMPCACGMVRWCDRGTQ